jgi:4-diphosphocytidyl-2-C-methyl-D-erythritol kinase
MVLQARAKLNLTLKILGLRPDGYHNIESVVQSIDLCDRVSLRTCAPVLAGGSDEEADIKVTCNDLSIPTGRGNLAVEAVIALAKFAGLKASVEINMEKGIPIAAGLGGGSADAAAILIGLNRLWKLGLGTQELMAVGESLGADIPFCVSGGTGIIQGKGERIELLPTPDNLWFVIVTLADRISTAQAYARFDQLAETTGAYDAGSCETEVNVTDVTSRMVRALRSGKVQDIADGLTNDLERCAISIVPSIIRVKEALIAAGAVGVGMSGSGPTVFGIADSRAKAEAISASLKQSSSGSMPEQVSPHCASTPVSSDCAFVSRAFKEVFVCQGVPQGVTCAQDA